MPGDCAAHNPYSTDQVKAELDCGRTGFSGPTARTMRTDFSLSPVSFLLVRLQFRKPPLAMAAVRMAGGSTRGAAVRPRAPGSKLRLNGSGGRGLRRCDGRATRFLSCARGLRVMEYLCVCSVQRFAAAPGPGCAQEPIPRRPDGRKRGMKTCR